YGLVWGLSELPEFVASMTDGAASGHPAFLDLDEGMRKMLAAHLAGDGVYLPYESIRALTGLLLRGEPRFPELAVVAASSPRLLLDLPALRDPAWYVPRG